MDVQATDMPVNDGVPVLFFEGRTVADDKQETITDRLWALISELSNINEYEYPYRIPKLQEKADEILKEIPN